MPAKSTGRSSKRGNRVNPSIRSRDACKKAAEFPKKVDGKATTTTSTRTNVSRNMVHMRGNRKSKIIADVQQPESESAVDRTQQSVAATQKPVTAHEENYATPKRRRRRNRRISCKYATRCVARKSTDIIRAKRANTAQEPSVEVPLAIFQNRKFVLTSAPRADSAGRSSDCDGDHESL